MVQWQCGNSTVFDSNYIYTVVNNNSIIHPTLPVLSRTQSQRRDVILWLQPRKSVRFPLQVMRHTIIIHFLLRLTALCYFLVKDELPPPPHLISFFFVNSPFNPPLRSSFLATECGIGGTLRFARKLIIVTDGTHAVPAWRITPEKSHALLMLIWLPLQLRNCPLINPKTRGHLGVSKSGLNYFYF